jgi:glycosyltransferase involved in cell wall biosynthesis
MTTELGKTAKRTNILARRIARAIKNLGGQPKLSIIVMSYSMPRQTLNTVYSLSSQYQQNVNEDEYEIFVVENASANNIDEAELKKLGSNINYLLRQEQSKSPVFAINEAATRVRGKNLAIMIDGARVATPGIVRSTLDAFNIDKNSVISVPGYHLGSEPQQHAVKHGYCENSEKALLDSIKWPTNGYQLFDIACFSGSSAEYGLLHNVPESNFLAMSKRNFFAIGAYHPGFNDYGGGYANLDIFKRAIENISGKKFLLLFEGTFHQFHGGATTGGDVGDRGKLLQSLTEQYCFIRGEEYQAPQTNFEVLGPFNTRCSRFLQESLQKLNSHNPAQGAQ